MAANPRVLPQPVRQFSLEFDDRLDAVTIDGIAPVPPELRAAVPERQLHFAAGRFCAARALRDLGVAGWERPVARTDAGAPAWPSGVVGSITHSRGFASAAVARTSDVGALGIDSEPVMFEERARAVAGVVAWPAEVAAARKAGLTRLEALTLVFSAKEAVFKCLHQRVGRMFGFHDVRLVDVCGEAGTFRVRFVKSLGEGLPAGRLLDGRFEVRGGWVHTAMCLAPPAAPHHD